MLNNKRRNIFFILLMACWPLFAAAPAQPVPIAGYDVTLISSDAIFAGRHLAGITIDPGNADVYVAVIDTSCTTFSCGTDPDQMFDLYRVTAGTAVLVGSYPESTSELVDLEWGPDNRVYYNDRLSRTIRAINPVTGASSPYSAVGGATVVSGRHSLDFDSSGTLILHREAQAFYQIAAGGSAILLGTYSAPNFEHGDRADIQPDGDFVVFPDNRTGPGNRVHEIETAGHVVGTPYPTITFAATDIGTLGGGFVHSNGRVDPVTGDAYVIHGNRGTGASVILRNQAVGGDLPSGSVTTVFVSNIGNGLTTNFGQDGAGANDGEFGPRPDGFVGNCLYFLDDFNDEVWAVCGSIGADLSVTKSDSADPAPAGANLTYTVTVSNAGPSAATNVVATDTLPAGTVLVSTSGCTEDPAGAPACSLGDIVAGGSAQYTVTVTTASSASGQLSNAVSVVSDTTDPDTTNNSISETTQLFRQVDIVMSKTESIDPVVAGSGAGNQVYVVTATNSGPSDLTGASFTEALTLPAGVTVVGTPLASTGSVGGSSPNYTWTGVNLAAGASATLTVTLTVTLEALEGTDVIDDTATFSTSTGSETIVNTTDDSALEATSIRWPIATFNVVKLYTGSGGPAVQVSLDCTDSSHLAFGDPGDGESDTALVWKRFDLLGAGASCSVVEVVPDFFYELKRTPECDVDPLVDEGVYDCTITNAPTVASFHVIKDFSDDNPLPVEVAISCNTGLPLTAQTAIRDNGNPDGGVTFVVETFKNGELDCEITETPVAGYAAEYQNLSVPATSDIACFYTAVVGGAEHSCVISNQVLPVSVDVTKQWITLGTGGDKIEKTASIRVFSPTNIEGGNACFNSEANENGYCKSLAFAGPQTQTQSVLVLPNWQGVTVLIDETVFDDAIETVNECDGSVRILPAQGAACTITNTVFFEGIPALDRYGLALLALLMLGGGLIGYRRYV